MADILETAAGWLLKRYRDATPGGFTDTELPAVRFFYTDQPFARAPLMYPPGLAFILAGKKIGYLDGHRFEYGAGSYLAVGLPLVFDCETFASRTAPLFGLFLELCPQMLLDLSANLENDLRTDASDDHALGVEPLSIQPSMKEAVTRLVRQLCTPPEARVLGRDTVREVFYHALLDTHGHVLASLTRLNRPQARVASLLQWLETQEDTRLSTDVLAKRAGMSTATLHRHFRAVTGYPPLQYLKRQKLMRAKTMMQNPNASVAQTAAALGYSDASSFSRDFRKLFGHPPSRTP